MNDVTDRDHLNRMYNDTTSSYMTELVEHFTTDGSGYAEETPTYDADGNLTYDGTQQYTYDAWNRLKTIADHLNETSATRNRER